jgi:hypothetical protein
MAEYFPEGRALFHCSAFPACFVPFGNRAVPYRAAQAVAYFRAWLPAPGAVDHVRRDVRPVELPVPLLRLSCAQIIVVRPGGDPRFAGDAAVSARKRPTEDLSISCTMRRVRCKRSAGRSRQAASAEKSCSSASRGRSSWDSIRTRCGGAGDGDDVERDSDN